MRWIVALIACAIACGPKIVNDRPVADLSKHLPATLEASRPREGDAKTIHVRIWVDAGVRAQPKWREEIIDQADYASQLLAPLLGVRIAIDKVSDWTRAGEPSAAATALAEQDKGEGATWVIGYIAPNDVATKVMSELGSAEPLGKYLIVRGWAEADTKALTATLPDLKGPERSEIVSAHRRHRQTVVLLHMVAAALGAIDEQDPTWIQNPTYKSKQVGFSDRNRELLQIAVDEKLAEQNDQTIAKKLLEAIEKSEFGGWTPASKDEVTKRLRIAIDAGKGSRTAKAIPPAAYDQFSRIQTLARQGNTKDALAELDNLLIAYPGNAAMHHARCEIMLAIGGPAAIARAKEPKPKQPKAPPAPKQEPPPQVDWKAACARAIEYAAGDPTPHLAIAVSYFQAKDIKAARVELLLAEDKIKNLPPGEIPDAWKKVISMYTELGALSWTDEAVTKGKLDNDPAALRVAQTRARYGIPQGAKFVVPEQEAELVGVIKDALQLVYANKFGPAEAMLSAAERRWSGAPGIASTRCDLSLRMGQLDAARAHCAKALAAQPTNSWALYLTGVIALKPGSEAATKQGIDQLKKAIAVDPDLQQAWRTLAKAYVRTKDKAAYEQLGKDYQAKFGSPLPP